MQIKNAQKDALKTSMSLPDFGKAMSQLDLSAIPPEKRRAAIMDHLMRIMVGTIHDRSQAADIAAAILYRKKLNG